MTPSPTPPPPLPRKPGLFDAPFWGWATALALPFLGSWLLLRVSGLGIFMSGLPTYMALQVDPQYASRLWPTVERLVGTQAAWVPALAIVLVANLLAALFARHRVAVLIAALGLAMGYIASLWAWPPSLGGAAAGSLVAMGGGLAVSWELEVARLALSLALAAAALYAWQRWLVQRGAAPSPLPLALVVVLMPLLGLAMVSGRTGSMEVAMVWESGWLFMDLMLPFLGIPLLGWLGVVAMMEGLGALKPNRRLVLGVWAAAVLVAGVVAGRSPSPGHFGSTDSWPLFASGSKVQGAALVWRDHSRWAYEPRDFQPEVSSAVRDLLSTGRVADPFLPGLTARMPNWVSLKADPFSPAQAYFSVLRRANPDLDTIIPGIILATILKQRPLTESEADDWLDLVISTPSHLVEDLALLGNLVGSGRRERAGLLSAHIRETLALSSAVEVASPKTEKEVISDSRRLALLEAYEEAIAAMPVPDGLARAISVRLVSEAGLPLVGVPVGLYQSRRLTPPDYPGGKAVVGRVGVGYSASGLFLRTDANGEVLFDKLNAVGYGSIVFAGWPDADLDADTMAVPLSDLPEVLPAGLTRQVWRVLPGGTFSVSSTEALTLDPEPAGPVAWVCQLQAANESANCPQAIDLRRVAEHGVGRTTNLPPIMELGPAGRPRFVWWSVAEETEAAEDASAPDAPAPADDTA
ncbi:hypothetical protein IIA16_01810 [bacterium]|nr:hypothetical protein [bacterium]